MAKPDLIKELQDKLYSRGAQNVEPIREHELSEKNIEAPNDWKREDAPAPLKPEDFMSSKPKSSFTVIFLIFAIIFFIGAFAFAFYSIKGGGNTVSAQNIDLGISGPVSSGGGEKVSLDIAITNRNKVLLRTTELIIDYPKGTKKAEDLGADLINERIFLGDIKSGETARKTITAVFFGEEKSVADIKFSLEYRIPNSNSIFSKDLIYQMVISSNPISLNVLGPKETVSGQDINFSVEIRSNSTEVIKNVLFQTRYPSGFAFKSATPKPASGETFWQLGDLAPGEKKTVTINGNLVGENEEARVFHFESGIGSSNDRTIPTLFAGFKQEVAIKKPFVGVSVSINGKSESEVIVPRNSPVNIQLSYINNLPISVRDAEIILNISGLAFDKNAIEVDNGFFQSANNTVLWDRSTLEKLGEVLPGEGGIVSLTLTPKGGVIQNPEIVMSANVKGKRVEESGVPEEIISTVTRHIKFESDVSLSVKSLYSESAIKNTGPVPPKAEVETTYSIMLTVTNGSNDVTDTVVRTTLPSYVRYIGEVYPGSENVLYDEAKKEVSWRAGVVRSGTGTIRASKQVTFKVGIKPSFSQVGDSPDLTGPFTLKGEDRFTNTPISLEKSAVDTKTEDLIGVSGEVVP